MFLCVQKTFSSNQLNVLCVSCQHLFRMATNQFRFLLFVSLYKVLCLIVLVKPLNEDVWVCKRLLVKVNKYIKMQISVAVNVLFNFVFTFSGFSIMSPQPASCETCVRLRRAEFFLIVAQPQCVCTLVDTATFFQPPFSNLGIFFFRGGGKTRELFPPNIPSKNLCKLSQPPTSTPADADCVSHQSRSFQLNFCVSCRLKSGLTVELHLHRTWYVLFLPCLTC